MTLAAMLADLPRACDVGTKRNAKGFKENLDRLQAAYRHRVTAKFLDQLRADGLAVGGMTVRSPFRSPPSPPGGLPISMT